jgi:DNA polymerase III subunit epsilon
MTRTVLFDTETTGLSSNGADRVIEVAALELMNDLPTGKVFHAMIDPQRAIPADATRIHGLTDRDVACKPLFADVAPAMLAFFGDAKLIAHNAPFDFGFIDMELCRIGMAPLARDRMIDSQALAKAKFPGMPNSLDALCRRFRIDLAERTTHNALLDCRLLARVYLELTGGYQRGLGFVQPAYAGASYGREPHTPIFIVPSDAEKAAHAAFVARLAGNLWAA